MIFLTGTGGTPHGTASIPHRYWWSSSQVLRVCLTGTDDLPHGYWGYASRVLGVRLMGTANMSHGYWWSSSRVLGAHPHRYCEYATWVLMIFLTSTAGMPHGYWRSSSRVLRVHPSQVLPVCHKGTDDLPHKYCGYASWVLTIFLMGTGGMPHGYCEYASWVLRVCLTGTNNLLHEYWGYASWVLRVCLMGTDDLPHRYCEYASRILMIFITSIEDSLYQVDLYLKAGHTVRSGLISRIRFQESNKSNSFIFVQSHGFQCWKVIFRGEGYRLNFEISPLCHTFYFNKLQLRNHKREGGGGKNTYFLKVLFKTNSEINVSRSWLWPYLKSLAPDITASRHMRRNEYSLKINVFFYLKAEKVENLSARFSENSVL